MTPIKQRLFSFLFLLSSCTSIQTLLNDPSDRVILKDYEPQSDIEHNRFLFNLGKGVLDYEGLKRVSLSRGSKSYLRGIFKRIVQRNAIIFDTTIEPEFHVFEYDKPIYFSLPYGHFYFSTSFLKLFLKHEGILISVLSHEAIRSLRGIYRKSSLVPHKGVDMARLLELVQLDIEVSHQLNIWSYHMIKRAFGEKVNYLLWLQLKNKNMIDFNFQAKSFNRPAREEQLFKTFLVRDGYESNNAESGGNSSPRFYSFLREVRRL